MRETSRKKLAEKLDSEITKLESQVYGEKNYLQQLVDTKTRDRIATTAVDSFFVLLALILVGAPVYNLVVDDQSLRLSLTDLLQQYAAILGPVLGFVIGYYFKTNRD